jgi:hypothetical protein
VKLGTPPLRFLVAIIGGWTVARAFFLAPAWITPPAAARDEAASDPVAIVQAAPLAEVDRGFLTPHPGHSRAKSRSAGKASVLFQVAPLDAVRPARSMPSASVGAPSTGTYEVGGVLPSARMPAPEAHPFPSPPAQKRMSAWSLSAWVFVRGGNAPSLVPGGTLGGAQAGARLAYGLAPGLSLSARAYAPLRRRSGTEAAIGLDWRPLGAVPLHFVAERRQKLGREGRSAFAIGAYAGREAKLGAFRVDAYGQAGVVGTRSRDFYADAMARISLPLRPGLRLGSGAWAAAQPGAERVDVGPSASVRLPISGCSATLAADWRFRVAGRAQPGSGPALTLVTEF